MKVTTYTSVIISCLIFPTIVGCASTPTSTNASQIPENSAEAVDTSTMSKPKRNALSMATRRERSAKGMSDLYGGGGFRMSSAKKGRTRFQYGMTMQMNSVSTMSATLDVDVELCKTHASLQIAVDSLLDPCNRALASSATVLRNRVVTTYHRGLISQHLGNIDDAKQDYHKALELDSNFGEANLALASLSYAEYDFVATRDYVVLALQQSIEHPAYAHYLKAMVHSQEFEFPQARAEFQAALKIKPRWREATNQLKYIDRNWPE